MEKLDTLAESDIPKTQLQKLHQEIGSLLASTSEELQIEIGQTERQGKYPVDDVTSLYQRLSELEGVVPIRRVYQTDYYVIPEGISPSFSSEHLRLREENHQELQGGIEDAGEDLTARLTYKTAASTVEGDIRALQSQSTKLNQQQALNVLEYLDGQKVRFRKIAKERAQFHYKGATVSIDQAVQFTTEDERSDMLGNGSFIEIKLLDKSQQTTIADIAQELNINQASIIQPYANIEFFNSIRWQHASANKAELQPPLSDFQFVDFDPVRNVLTDEVDWHRVLKAMNRGLAGSLISSPEKINGLAEALQNKLGILKAKIQESSDSKLRDVLSNNGQAGGRIGGSIKLLNGVDGFSSYPRPKELLKEHTTFEIRGLAHNQIQGDGVRVMLTVGRTKDGTVVFFPHKIYMTKSDKDDQGSGQKGNSPAGWIQRHQQR